VKREVFLACLLVLLALAACKGEPDPTPWCSATQRVDVDAAAPSPTWHRDVKPVVDAKCTRCHAAGGIGPFPLETWDHVFRRQGDVRRALERRHMPPWHAARCCTEYYQDTSLTEPELATFLHFLDVGAPIGDAQNAPPPLPRIGGVSRADVVVALPAPYVPAPRRGTDENRCFLVRWPLASRAFVTGFNPVPGERTIVHHLAVGALEGDTLDEARGLDGRDGRPGFDCGELKDMGLRDLTYLGGGLVGGDFPDGLGREIDGNATLLINVHYSLASAPAKPDLTKVEFRVDPEARPFKNMAVANIAWLVGEGMKVPANEKAIFHYAFEPKVFTRGKTVLLRNVTPHMHALASKIVVRIIREDDRRECLLEIPDWHFGWTQPYWFAKPKRLDPGDRIYVECHIDNTRDNQPNGGLPRDVAWGDNNQEMCAAFLNFTEGDR
jgi:hypothetical protein